MIHKLIIFDLGNVLLNFDFTPAIQRLEAHGVKNSEAIHNLFRTSELALDWDKGLVEKEAFYLQVKKTLGFSLSENEFKKIWNEIFSENKKMVQLARQMKQQHKVVVLSNTNPFHEDYIRGQYAWIHELDY